MASTRAVYGMGAGAGRGTPARYLPKVNLIEVKRGNLTDFWHEAGHVFDERSGQFSRMAELGGELDALGAQGHSSWRPGLSNLRRRQEGFAEFQRLWFEDADEARRVAPRTFEAFEAHLDTLGDKGSAWRQHRYDYQLRLESDPAAQWSAHIRNRDRGGLWKFTTLDNVVQGVFDRYRPLEMISEMVAKERGVRILDPMDDVYVQARMLNNTSQVKQKQFAEQLQELLDEVNVNTETAQRFRDYLAAKHAEEMILAGMEVGEPLHIVRGAILDMETPQL